MGRSACPTRTARYMRRVEAHLPALRDDYARRDFISREMDKWEERYARFIATEGDAHRRGDDADQPSAFDFTETIAALGAVHVTLQRRQPHDRTTTPARPHPLRPHSRNRGEVAGGFAGGEGGDRGGDCGFFLPLSPCGRGWRGQAKRSSSRVRGRILPVCCAAAPSPAYPLSAVRHPLPPGVRERKEWRWRRSNCRPFWPPLSPSQTLTGRHSPATPPFRRRSSSPPMVPSWRVPASALGRRGA